MTSTANDYRYRGNQGCIIYSTRETGTLLEPDFDVKPVVRARFEPRRDHHRSLLVMQCICGRDRTEATESVGGGDHSILLGTLNFLIKFCHSTGIA